MYIVKQEKRDFKGRFSLFEIELKNGVDVSFPDIKKAGRTQTHQQDGRATITSSTNIKTNRKSKDKKKDGSVKQLFNHLYYISMGFKKTDIVIQSN